MKRIESILVSQDLLNELGTLAAPSMLAAALRATQAELGDAGLETMTLFSYRAEFKEGARQGDTVQVALEEAGGVPAGERAFNVYFSKGDKLGRVGHWRLVFSGQRAGRRLPYSISQAAADGRTDRELWRPQPVLASGDSVQDGQALLWLAGQSARGYLKRLDQELAATGNYPFYDEVATRIYGGIFVTVHLAQGPEQGQILYCALQHQLPLQNQAPDRKMDFHGVLVSGSADDTLLLGTFRFTVARLNAQRAAIYPDGATQRK